MRSSLPTEKRAVEIIHRVYIPIIVVSFANIQGYFWQKKVLKVGFFATDGVEDLSPAVETNLDMGSFRFTAEVWIEMSGDTIWPKEEILPGSRKSVYDF